MIATSPAPVQVLYTARTRTTGGREGRGQSDDGRLDVQLGSPGSSRPGTNPEQLFAVGWSACFIGAMGLAAQAIGVKLPADTDVEAAVDLNKGSEGYSLSARLRVSLPGLPRDTAYELVKRAHATCSYSKMTCGNIDVGLELA